jgi:hypothetical protein
MLALGAGNWRPPQKAGAGDEQRNIFGHCATSRAGRKRFINARPDVTVPCAALIRMGRIDDRGIRPSAECTGLYGPGSI